MRRARPKVGGMRRNLAAALLACALSAFAAAPAAAAPKPGPVVTTPSGLRYQDEVIGKGPAPTTGQHVTVNYVGMLTNGKTFDSSDPAKPFTFTIGMGQVIKGWDEGVMSMHVGGRRKLIIPAALGYGEKGAGDGVIPPNATLIFVVDLLAVN